METGGGRRRLEREGGAVLRRPRRRGATMMSETSDVRLAVPAVTTMISDEGVMAGGRRPLRRQGMRDDPSRGGRRTRRSHRQVVQECVCSRTRPV